MAISVVSTVTFVDTTGGGGSSSAIDTSTAKAIAICVATYASTATTPSDSKGNSWTATTLEEVGGGQRCQWHYCINPTTDASHVFNASAATGIHVIALTATDDLALDTALAAGNSNYPTPLTIGATTPSEASNITLHGAAWNTAQASDVTIDGSFTAVTGQFDVGAGNKGGFAAYKIQASASATNPTITFSDATSASGRVIGFKEVAGGAPATNPHRAAALLGVG